MSNSISNICTTFHIQLFCYFRFVDRDIGMRFRGGGVGHTSTREATDKFCSDRPASEFVWDPNQAEVVMDDEEPPKDVTVDVAREQTENTAIENPNIEEDDDFYLEEEIERVRNLFFLFYPSLIFTSSDGELVKSHCTKTLILRKTMTFILRKKLSVCGIYFSYFIPLSSLHLAMAS